MAGHPQRNYDDPAAPRACQNCGTPLRGPYCSKCGQHDIDYHRSFYHLTHDLLENLFHFDGNLLVSLTALLTKPGRLTVDFNAGRRASQVPPLRFYIFVTVLFFVGLHLLNHGHLLSIDRLEADKAGADLRDNLARFQAPSDFTPAQKTRYGELIGDAIAQQPGSSMQARLTAEQRDAIIAQVRAETAPGAKPAEAPAGKKAPVAVRPAGEYYTTAGRAFSEKLRSGEFTPSRFLDEFEARVPTALFLCMPLFALLLKLLYAGSGRYYIEHLIFSIHLHTWAFIALMVGSGYYGLARLGPHGFSRVAGVFLLLGAAWYVFAAFRVVYAQRWWVTLLKMAAAGAAYFLMIIGLTAALVLFTIAWLVYT